MEHGLREEIILQQEGISMQIGETALEVHRVLGYGFPKRVY